MTGHQKVLQCNLNRNMETTEATLQLAIELGVEIIAVQEPWIAHIRQRKSYEGAKSISHPSFIQVFPQTMNYNLRPRTMFYISRKSNLQYHQPQGYPRDPDILAVTFNSHEFNMIIINIYNQKNQSPENNLTTIERNKEAFSVSSNTIIVMARHS